MVNYHEEFVKALSTVLPTYYELNLTADIEEPCISYIETNNYAEEVGDTLGYSRIVYQVKIWGDDIGYLQFYAQQVDRVLRPLGFKRTSSNELHNKETAQIQKILSYEAKASEDF